MEIVYKRLEEICPYDKNPRNNADAVPYVANSIKEFGFKVPIVIDKNGTIVAGHTRYLASKKLKLDKVPCIIADDLTDEQIKAYRLADNKVSEPAEWDDDLLSLELDGILDIDMESFGFEIDDIFEETETDTETQETEEDDFADIEKLEKHYGVPYQGNKSRIADIIINILPAGKRLVDLFGGGGGDNSLCFIKWQMGIASI